MKINPYPHPFIVIEGIDGSGKTTLIQKLQQWDNESKIGSIFTKEPTDGEIGREIREILKKDGLKRGGQKITAEELQKLYIEDRLIHRQMTAAFLEEFPVFSDRDFPSTLAYGLAEGLDPEWILKEHERILEDFFFAPDLIIILDLEPEEAMKRSEKKGGRPDYFEEKLALREKIREAYLEFPGLMEKLYPDAKLNIQVIDASLSAEEIFKNTLAFIKKVFEMKRR